MNIYPRVPQIEPEFITDGSQSLLEGHPGTVTGRFQGREENVQIPRAMIMADSRRTQNMYRGLMNNPIDPLLSNAIDTFADAVVQSRRAPLRGQTEHIAMVDDYGNPLQETPETTHNIDAEKARMCILIAEYIFRDWSSNEITRRRVHETAIDLMSTPTMNIERIFKRIGPIKSNKPMHSPKLLNRFQILKKE